MNTSTLRVALWLAGGLTLAALSLSGAPVARAATITVTTQSDLFGVGPIGCSLRRAINAANNDSDYNGCVGVGAYGNDVIVFDPSIAVITLTLGSGGGDNDSNGYRDLDIGGSSSGALSIIGPPAGVVIAASAGIADRVFDVLPTGNFEITLTNLIIRNGSVPDPFFETGTSNDFCYQGGGGIRHRGDNLLILDNVRVEHNSARSGGGICHQGAGLRVNDSVIRSNTAQGRDGGGIASDRATVISRTRILSNTAVISEAVARGGGGIFCSADCRSLEVFGGSVSYNTAQRVNATADEAHGGGINTRSPTTLTQVSLVDNTLSALSAPGHNALGGGVYSALSLVANQLLVMGNSVTATSSASGGGLYTSGATAEINGGEILSNTARRGGGWHNTVPEALLLGSEVRFNQATERGGGVANESAGDVGIVNAVICDNRATGASSSGGGVSNAGSGASLYVQDSVLCNNTAQNGGGGANSASAALIVLGTWITSNQANVGGGIAHAGSLLRVEASGITSNTASNSGGGLWSNATFSILNSTFSANQANVSGGGLSLIGGSGYLTYTTIASHTVGAGMVLQSGAIAHLRATLLAGNSPQNCVIASATLTSQNDNLSSDASCPLGASNDLTNTQPLLRPLEMNGGLAASHRPLPHSLALNRIPPARCVASDQRGVARPQNGACDVGAVELPFWRAYAPITRKP